MALQLALPLAGSTLVLTAAAWRSDLVVLLLEEQEAAGPAAGRPTGPAGEHGRAAAAALRAVGWAAAALLRAAAGAASAARGDSGSGHGRPRVQPAPGCPGGAAWRPPAGAAALPAPARAPHLRPSPSHPVSTKLESPLAAD